MVERNLVRSDDISLKVSPLQAAPLAGHNTFLMSWLIPGPLAVGSAFDRLRAVGPRQGFIKSRLRRLCGKASAASKRARARAVFSLLPVW